MADLLERKWALFSPLPLILGLGKRRDFMDRDVKRNIAENAPIENPPEGGAGRDPLQDLSPEACTFEVFQQLNSKTGQRCACRRMDSGHSRPPALGTCDARLCGRHAAVFCRGDGRERCFRRHFAVSRRITPGAVADGRDAVCALRYMREPPRCRTEIYCAVPVFPV